MLYIIYHSYNQENWTGCLITAGGKVIMQAQTCVAMQKGEK